MGDIEFKITPKIGCPSEQMVELWRDGEIVAGIYSRPGGIGVVGVALHHFHSIDCEQLPDQPREVTITIS